jgi:hypothetical protein
MAESAKKDVMSLLAEEVKSFDESVELNVDVNGQQIPIKMFPFFKPDKIRKCVEDLVSFFMKSKEEKLVITESDEEDIVGYFIIKYFTDIKMTNAKKAKSIMKEIELLRNSKLYKVLMKSYPKESIQDVYDQIYDIIETNAELENNFKKYKDIIQNLPLKNKESFDIE